MTPAFTVQRLPFDPDTELWDGPVPVPVFGWAPAASTEPHEASRDALVREVDLLLPPGTTCHHRDRWLLDDDAPWEQEGTPAWFTTGPFGFHPGGQVRLRRVEG